MIDLLPFIGGLFIGVGVWGAEGWLVGFLLGCAVWAAGHLLASLFIFARMIFRSVRAALTGSNARPS